MAPTHGSNYQSPYHGYGGCSNRCYYAYDGECDDGGPNSELSGCSYGTDCYDCGSRYRSLAETTASEPEPHPQARVKTEFLSTLPKSLNTKLIHSVAKPLADARRLFTNSCFKVTQKKGLWETCAEVEMDGYNYEECVFHHDDMHDEDTHTKKQKERIYAAEGFSLLAIVFGIIITITAFMSHKYVRSCA
jgi:hypothetical protein